MSIFFDVINVVGITLEILIALSFFNTVSRKRQVPSYAEFLTGLLCVIIQSVVTLFIVDKIIITLILFLQIIGLSFLYKLTAWKRFLFTVLLVLLFVLSELATGLILSAFSNVSVEQLSGDNLYYMQLVLISKLVVFIIIKIIGSFSIKSEVKVAGYIYLPLITLHVATFLVIYVLSVFTFRFRVENLLGISIITVVLLIIGNILVFYLYEYQLKIIEKQKQEQMLKQQLEYKAEYYKELSRRQQITNKTMHNLKNQLFALREVLKNDTESGTDMIDAIFSEIMSSYSIKFTGIEAVDALITSKLQIMQEKDIHFSNSAYISEKGCPDIMDFCILLGNLLDNAIEANDKVPYEKRYINLNITQQQDYLSIAVGNSISESVKIEKNKILSTKKYKELHGFGLKSVNEIVKKYNGKCTFRQKEGEFEVIIMLNNK